jgi:hypothetical protein
MSITYIPLTYLYAYIYHIYISMSLTYVMSHTHRALLSVGVDKTHPSSPWNVAMDNDDDEGEVRLRLIIYYHI